MAPGGMNGDWPAPLASMAVPPQIEPDEAARAAQVADLNRDYPGWSTWCSDGGLVWSARKGPWAEPMTLATDNPRQMRGQLGAQEAAAA